VAPDHLAQLDPDEFYSEHELRARRRRERRSPARKMLAGIAERLHMPLMDTRIGRVLVWLVAGLFAATVFGLVVLWPGGDVHAKRLQVSQHTQAASVKRAYTVDCPGPTPQRCKRLDIEVGGKATTITLGPVTASPPVRVGDRIRVIGLPAEARKRLPAGAESYTFADLDRRAPLVWLFVLVGGFAVVMIRLRGLLALLGAGVSLLLVTQFIVPALLDGRSATLTALVGALAVMFVTLALTNGIGPQSLAAALGIGSTLAATTVVSLLAVRAVHIDGYSSELASYLSQQTGARLSLQGVVLAGMIIGALGVLTDTAVTQASAVMALRKADPRLDARGLYRSAFVVGRDHLSATIHTLVLAYAGATLPLLLVMRSSNVGLADAFNSQEIAEPIAATLVGVAGLIAAVPITTALAAALVSRVPPDALGAAHAHAH
jgi:uncharacterized membrane protein